MSILFNRRGIEVKFSSNFLIACMIITFGYFGYGTGIGDVLQLKLVVEGSLLFSLTYVIFRRYELDGVMKGRLKFTFIELFIVLVLTVVLFLSNKTLVSQDLVVDELAYARGTHVYSYYFLENLSSYIPGFLLYARTSQIMQLISLFGLLVFLFCLQIIFRLRDQKKFFVFVVILVGALRFMFYHFGGITYSNSPLFMWGFLLVTSFFGISDFAFRLASNLVLALTALVLQKLMKKYNYSNLVTINVLAFYCTVLISFRISGLVEPAMVGFAVNLIICFLLAENLKHLVRVFPLILIVAVYLRVQSIFLVLLYLVYLFYDESKTAREKRLIVLALSMATCPIIVVTALARLSDAGKFDGIGSISSTKMSIFWEALYLSNYFLLVILTLIIALLCIGRFTLQYLRFLVVYSLLAFAVFVLLMPTSMLPNSKYFLEWISPISLVLFMNGLKSFSTWRTWRFPRTISLAVVLILIVSIVRINANLESRYKSVYVENSMMIGSAHKVLPFTPYPPAYESKGSSNTRNCISLGVVYGSIREALDGQSLNEWLRANEFKEKLSLIQKKTSTPWTEVSFELVSDTKVECIKISAIDNFYEFLEDASGRSEFKVEEFTNVNFGTKVLVVKRTD